MAGPPDRGRLRRHQDRCRAGRAPGPRRRGNGSHRHPPRGRLRPGIAALDRPAARTASCAPFRRPRARARHPQPHLRRRPRGWRRQRREFRRRSRTGDHPQRRCRCRDARVLRLLRAHARPAACAGRADACGARRRRAREPYRPGPRRGQRVDHRRRPLPRAAARDLRDRDRTRAARLGATGRSRRRNVPDRDLGTRAGLGFIRISSVKRAAGDQAVRTWRATCPRCSSQVPQQPPQTSRWG